MPKKTKRIKHTDKNKPWNKRTTSSKGYQLNSREKKKVFLIICEGENTEPEYFKSFPLSNAKVESYGLGATKTALVEHVIHILADEKPDEDREVWIVFDMDLDPKKQKQNEDFNNAIQLAINNDFNAAYSNDSFELWFVLHYQMVDAKLRRFEYYDILSKLWNLNYSKKGKEMNFCRTIYRLLLDDKNASQKQALKFAERLFKKQKDSVFSEQNPCTKVYELVKQLNEYL